MTVVPARIEVLLAVVNKFKRSSLKASTQPNYGHYQLGGLGACKMQRRAIIYQLLSVLQEC